MAATPKEFYDALVALIATKVPGFQVRFKNESRLQRFIGTLLFFNRAYMTDFITTFYPYVYFPTRKDVEENYSSAWRTLAHEYVHLLDNKASPLLFRLRYLAPQVFAVFALGTFAAFWTPWAWFCLLFLLALAPWPSRGRTALELRGYTMSLAVNFWPRRIEPTAEVKENTKGYFTGWAYYRMSWSDSKIRAALEEAVRKMKTDELLKGPGSEPYVDVFQLLQSKGLIFVNGAAVNV